MKQLHMLATLSRSTQRKEFVFLLDEDELTEFLRQSRGQGDMEWRILQLLRSKGMLDPASLDELHKIAMDFSITLTRASLDGVEMVASSSSPPRRVEKCRSILRIANRLLPEGSREEALDEWMDEIETAAAKELPVFRRTASIVVRSLPVLALRIRLPARAPRGGS